MLERQSTDSIEREGERGRATEPAIPIIPSPAVCIDFFEPRARAFRPSNDVIEWKYQFHKCQVSSAASQVWTRREQRIFIKLPKHQANGKTKRGKKLMASKIRQLTIHLAASHTNRTTTSLASAALRFGQFAIDVGRRVALPLTAYNPISGNASPSGTRAGRRKVLRVL